VRPLRRPEGIALLFFVGGAVLLLLVGAPLFVLGMLRPEQAERNRRDRTDGAGPAASKS